MKTIVQIFKNFGSRAAFYFLLLFFLANSIVADSRIPKLTVGRNGDGQLEVFRVGADGNLFHRFRNSTTGEWSAWQSLGGSVLPEVCVTSNTDGLITAFAVSRRDGAIEYATQLATNSSKWSPWNSLGGKFRSGLASALNQDGHLEVFGVDAATLHVRYAYQNTPGGSWSDWADLGNSSAQPGLVAPQNVDGRLEVFGLNADGQLIHCWQRGTNVTDGWSEWSSLRGNILPGFTVSRDTTGKLEVFGIDSASGAAARIRQLGGGTSSNWSEWIDFGGTFLPGIVSGRSWDGRIEIFAVNKNDSIVMHRWEDFANGSDIWSDWASLGGATAACPAVDCDEDGDLEVFAVDPTNHNAVNYRRQISAASDWLDWASLDEPAFSFMVRSWQVGDGLPDNVVQAIAQTPDGYLWVGTRNGLGRFDGIEFAKFDSRNTPEIGANAVSALCASADGALWVGTTGGGVARFQDGVWTHFGSANGLAGDDVRALYESVDGALWIGTATGISRYRNKVFVNYTQKEGLSSDTVNYFCQDRDGNLWIATSAGLDRMKKGGAMNSFAMPNGLPNNSVRAIYQDKGGRIWIGSNNGLLWYDQYWANHFFAYSTKYGLSDMFVSAISEGRDGNLWVGTYSGLNRFHGSRFYHQLDNQGQPFSKVNALLDDREGDLWVGTQEGLIRLTRNYFVTYTQQQGLTHNNIMSVLQDRHGTMWIGTWGGGLDKMNGDEVVPALSTHAPLQNLVLSLCEAHDGTIWMGSDFDGGLTKTKNGKSLRYTWRNGLPNARIQVLHEDGAKNLWIGTSAGLSHFHDGHFTNYTTNSGLAGNNIHAIEADGGGGLWLGSDGGLTCLTNEQFVNYTTGAGLSNNPVIALHSGKDGTLWIGTSGGGLLRYKNGHFTGYTTRQGMGSDVVFSILEDNHGWLWMSCPQGIFRVRKEDLFAVDAGKTKSVSAILYGKLDGMESPQCNGDGQPSAWKSSDGRLWFPTTKGLVTVNPESLKIDPFPPGVCIEQLVADRQSQLPENWPQLPENASKSVTFPPGNGQLEFQYTALNLCSPEKSRFRYKLDGVNTEWVEAGERRTAYYDNIAPGAYRFRVAACNKDGVWNERGASISFVLTPFYWQKPWFRAAAGAAVVAAISGLVLFAARQRMRRKLAVLEQQQAIEKERRRIAKDMHDQLGAGLTQIGLLGEFARREQTQSGPARAHVEKICDVTRELAQTVDEIVWAVNPRNDTLNKLAVYLAAYAEDFFHVTPVRCRLDIPPGLPAIPLSAEVRHNVFLVVKEALNNIVKHARASEAWIRLGLRNSTLEICIEDNGIGISPDAHDSSRNGVFNMMERLKEIHGTIAITRRNENGTRVSLSVPLNSSEARIEHLTKK